MNLLALVPVTSRSFEGGSHPTFRLQRTAVWPLVRGNATWLVPTPRSGPSGSCPYCHEYHGIELICDWRPSEPVCDYEIRCPACGYPQVYHGVLGVVFCAGCGGALRVQNEMDRGSAGQQMAAQVTGTPPRGDGGPTYYYTAWEPIGNEIPSCNDQTETCFLCKRALPISAFLYSQREYGRDHGGWRCSRRCRRCQQEWLESLYMGADQGGRVNTEPKEDHARQPR